MNRISSYLVAENSLETSAFYFVFDKAYESPVSNNVDFLLDPNINMKATSFLSFTDKFKTDSFLVQKLTYRVKGAASFNAPAYTHFLKSNLTSFYEFEKPRSYLELFTRFEIKSSFDMLDEQASWPRNIFNADNSFALVVANPLDISSYFAYNPRKSLEVSYAFLGSIKNSFTCFNLHSVPTSAPVLIFSTFANRIDPAQLLVQNSYTFKATQDLSVGSTYSTRSFNDLAIAYSSSTKLSNKLEALSSYSVSAAEYVSFINRCSERTSSLLNVICSESYAVKHSFDYLSNCSETISNSFSFDSACLSQLSSSFILDSTCGVHITNNIVLDNNCYSDVSSFLSINFDSFNVSSSLESLNDCKNYVSSFLIENSTFEDTVTVSGYAEFFNDAEEDNNFNITMTTP